MSEFRDHFETPIDRVRERESRDWWEQEKQDRQLEQADIETNRPKGADDGPGE